LRIDDDGVDRILAQCRPEAGLFLTNAVGPALAGAVQKEDDAI